MWCFGTLRELSRIERQVFSLFSFNFKSTKWFGDICQCISLVIKESADAVDAAGCRSCCDWVHIRQSFLQPSHQLCMRELERLKPVFSQTDMAGIKARRRRRFAKIFPTVLANPPVVGNLSVRCTNKKGLFIKPPPDCKIKSCHILCKVSIQSPSLIKPRLIKLRSNTSFLKLKQNHLCQKSYQKWQFVTLHSLSPTLKVLFFLRPCFRLQRIPHQESVMRTRRCKERRWPTDWWVRNF